jgi:hypothetical protein
MGFKPADQLAKKVIEEDYVAVLVRHIISTRKQNEFKLSTKLYRATATVALIHQFSLAICITCDTNSTSLKRMMLHQL